MSSTSPAGRRGCQCKRRVTGPSPDTVWPSHSWWGSQCRAVIRAFSPAWRRCRRSARGAARSVAGSSSAAERHPFAVHHGARVAASRAPSSQVERRRPRARPAAYLPRPSAGGGADHRRRRRPSGRATRRAFTDAAGAGRRFEAVPADPRRAVLKKCRRMPGGWRNHLAAARSVPPQVRFVERTCGPRGWMSRSTTRFQPARSATRTVASCTSSHASGRSRSIIG